MISSPISTSTHRTENRSQSPNRLLHDSICEENTKEAEQLEEQTLIAQCKCLSFQVKNCSNQHEEGSLDQNCNQVICTFKCLSHVDFTYVSHHCWMSNQSCRLFPHQNRYPFNLPNTRLIVDSNEVLIPL